MIRHAWNLMIGVFSVLLLLLTGCASQTPRVVQDFDFDWKFMKADMPGAQQASYVDIGWRDVQLPHDWSIEGPYSQNYASGTGFLPGGIGWYRKSFTLPASLKDKRIAIEFDGVYNNSEVWINGHALGKRPFGYISFQYDLTDYIKWSPARNVIAVRVDHSAYADSRWYTGSGIYRNVRLRITDPLCIDHWGTCVTTPVANNDVAEVQIATTISNHSAEEKTFTLRSTIVDSQGQTLKTVDSTQTIEAGATQTITQKTGFLKPSLWSSGSPSLYRLESKLMIGRKVADNSTTRFGIRSFRFDPDHGFFLNGENMKLKGVCLHHDAGPLGAAVPKQVWRTRLQAIKEIGCNAIRCSHNPPSPEFLDLCDEMGFLVQDEAFDEFTPPKNKWVEGWNKGTPSKDGYGDVFEEWAVRDIQDMVRRDRNHPSIIMWSIGNEVDYRNDPFSHPLLGDEYRPQNPKAENLTKYGAMLVTAVKELDTTRPVTAALATATMSNAVGFSDLLDIVGYNYQEKLYADHHAQYPDRVLYGSENSNRYEAWKAVEDNDYISGQFVWTGIDYLGEAGAWPYKSWTRSLFDLCCNKKPQGWFRQSIWTDTPMVYVACQPETRGGRQRSVWGWADVRPHWNWGPGSQINIVCYSNCDEVELFLNGTSLGSKPMAEARSRVLTWPDCAFEAGTLKAVGKRNGQVVCNRVLQTAGAPAKIELIPDTTELAADGKDVCQLKFRIVDENGVRIPDAEDLVTFDISGPAKIIALGNADPTSHESHQGNQRSTWRGRGLAVIQSKRQAGTVTIRVSADGLAPARLELRVYNKSF